MNKVLFYTAVETAKEIRVRIFVGMDVITRANCQQEMADFIERDITKADARRIGDEVFHTRNTIYASTNGDVLTIGE